MPVQEGVVDVALRTAGYVLLALVVVGCSPSGSPSTASRETAAPAAPEADEDEDPGAPATDPADAERSTEPAAPDPEPASTPPGDGVAGVGDAVTLPSGSVARVNAAAPDAAATTEFVQPEPGSTFTSATVEVCAGTEGQSVNPLNWEAFLDDDRAADVALGAQTLATIDLPPGGCAKGDVLFEVPEGQAVARVVLNEGFDAVARWDAGRSAAAVEGPLPAPVDLDAAPLGAPAATPAADVTVHAVVAGSAPANEFIDVPEGSSLTALDVEVCATEAGSVNPLSWAVQLDDNTVVDLNLGGQTFPTSDLAAGECARGNVDFVVPDGRTAVVAYFTPAALADVAAAFALAG